MKLSIVIGVIHMSFGILMRAFNAYHFGSCVDFIFEFIPQIFFFLCTFGYMVAAIIIKWTQNWEGRNPPGIINIYTGMGITGPDAVLWGDDQGVQQTWWQQHFFLLAILLTPFLLIPKPIIVHMQNQAKKKNRPVTDNLETGLMDEEQGHAAGGHEDEGFGEIFIHQMIETIEFVLGTISNTASYLRLWALSLAHSQLAKVFLNMTIMNGVKAGNFLVVILGFPIWIGATVGVLMLMDVMECFLHALRLHWVEFQNKFFKGDGYLFKPFSFKSGSMDGLAELKETYAVKK